jgi:5'-3' exonuclease
MECEKKCSEREEKEYSREKNKIVMMNKKVISEVEKMVNKNCEEEKKYMLNVDFIDFIVRLKKEKVEIGVGNLEKIKEEYKRDVGLKFGNSWKVGGRMGSENRRDKLVDYLKNNGMGISEKEVIKGISELVVLSGKKSIKRRYI